MPWIRRKLRGNLVFAKCKADATPAAGRDGRVDIIYKLRHGAKVYRAAAANLEPSGEDGDDELLDIPGGPPIIVYTDGACTGNPGPAGIGAVIMDGEDRKELSEYLGDGTNNIAELTAIERALEVIGESDYSRPVVIHTDSSYSIGILTKNWKAKANIELVARLKDLVNMFDDVSFVKVKGHAGIPENERCDELARNAITDNA
jgi:ribonuclease HI